MPSEESARKREDGMPNLKRIIQELGRGGQDEVLYRRGGNEKDHLKGPQAHRIRKAPQRIKIP